MSVADFDISELSPEALHVYQVGLASRLRLQQQIIGHTYAPISRPPRVVLTEPTVTPVTTPEPVEEPITTTQAFLSREHEFFRQTKWREEIARRYPAPQYHVVWSPEGAAIYEMVAEPEKAEDWGEWFGEAVSGLGTRFEEGWKEMVAPSSRIIFVSPEREPVTWKLLEQIHYTQEWLRRMPVETTTLPVFERQLGGLGAPTITFEEYDLGEQFAELLEPAKLPVGFLSEIESFAYGTPTVSGAAVQTIASIFTGEPTLEPLQEYYEIMGPWGTLGGLLGTYMIGKAFTATGREVWRGTKWLGTRISQYVKGTYFYQLVLEPGVRIGKESVIRYGLEPAYRGIQAYVWEPTWRGLQTYGIDPFVRGAKAWIFTYGLEPTYRGIRTYGLEPAKRGLLAYGYEPLKWELTTKFVDPTLRLAKEFQIYGRSVLWPQVQRKYVDPTAQLFRDYVTPVWSLAQETKLYGKAVVWPQIRETVYRYGVAPLKRRVSAYFIGPTKTQLSRFLGMDLWRELKYGWQIKALAIHYVPKEPYRGIILTRGITGLPYRGLMGPTPKSVSLVTSKELALLSQYAAEQATKQAGMLLVEQTAKQTAKQIAKETSKLFMETAVGLATVSLVQTVTPQKKKRKQKKALTILHAWTGPQYPSIYQTEKEWGKLELEPYPTITFEPLTKKKVKGISAQRLEQFSVPRLEPFEIPGFEQAGASMTQQAQRIRQEQKQVQEQIQKQRTVKPFRLKFDFPKPKKRKEKDPFGAWFKRKRHIKTPEEMIKTYMEMKI